MSVQLAGVIALVKPLTLNSQTRHLHLPVAVGSTLLLCLLLALRRGVDRRAGAALLALYFAYLATAIALA